MARTDIMYSSHSFFHFMLRKLFSRGGGRAGWAQYGEEIGNA